MHVSEDSDNTHTHTRAERKIRIFIIRNVNFFTSASASNRKVVGSWTVMNPGIHLALDTASEHHWDKCHQVCVKFTFTCCPGGVRKINLTGHEGD